MVKVILVFISTLLVDVMWSIYIKKVAQGNAFGATWTTLVIYLLGGFVIINYTQNHLLLFSATLGACIGTYFSTKYIK